MTPRTVDVLVIGGGPSGMKAAIQAAKLGKQVVLVERERGLGGECIHRGTIPSKTLRETASYLAGLRARTAGLVDGEIGAGLKLSSLMTRLKTVLEAHHEYLGNQISRNEIDHTRGIARFTSPSTVEVVRSDGPTSTIEAEVIVLATGSRPRSPEDVPVDHEHVLDSDSVLSMIYLPRSMVILGAGVIACEFAAMLAALDVKVTLIDKHDRPLGFMDPELTDQFVESFESRGGRFLGGAKIRSVRWDGVCNVETEVETKAGRETLTSEKVLCALGRVANVRDLSLEAAGIELTARGLVPVDEDLRTEVAHIFAVGDIIGPPALATTAMAQGRRAVRAAFGLESERREDLVPVGIYTMPEMSSVGESEDQVTQRLGSCVVGRSAFAELARAHINGDSRGLLKLVCDPRGEKLLGAHIVGAGATDLVHIAQMAIYAGLEVDAFVENVFNFPTLAEAYRVAALDVLAQRMSGNERRSAA